MTVRDQYTVTLSTIQWRNIICTLAFLAEKMPDDRQAVQSIQLCVDSIVDQIEAAHHTH